MAQVIHYKFPENWIVYDRYPIHDALLSAKANVLALRAIPFQRRWVKELQEVQLKLEIGGSSKIEGADFAGNELETAIRAETAEELLTRSQRQAHALAATYKMVAAIPDDRPITVELIQKIHRRVIRNCDDDHCEGGAIRTGDDQVSFGIPKHRGALAGEQCLAAIETLAHQAQTTFAEHDPLVQALALHYHFAAMHPFLDGNGRTARALEALALQRAGLKDSLFVAMSNYYYDEKQEYLKTLAEVRANDYNLTPFLLFGLRGIALQTGRLADMIKRAVSKEIYRNLMLELFARLESTRKRVIVKRQLDLLERLLNLDREVDFFEEFVPMVKPSYAGKKKPVDAVTRDTNRLLSLGAIKIRRQELGSVRKYFVQVDLDWPSRITETEFFTQLAALPKSKDYGFLAHDH